MKPWQADANSSGVGRGGVEDPEIIQRRPLGGARERLTFRRALGWKSGVGWRVQAEGSGIRECSSGIWGCANGNVKLVSKGHSQFG